MLLIDKLCTLLISTQCFLQVDFYTLLIEVQKFHHLGGTLCALLICIIYTLLIEVLHSWSLWFSACLVDW